MTTRTNALPALLAIATLVAGGALVSACDSGDRPLNYEKGVYKGKSEPPIDEATLDRLRDRASYQSGPNISTSPGFSSRSGGVVGGPARPVSAAPPAQPQQAQQEQPQAQEPQQAQQPAPEGQPQAQDGQPPAKSPAEESQAQESPVQESQAQESPVQESPAQESPVQESQAQGPPEGDPAKPAAVQGDAGARPADQ
ncbi:MAG: hypothetical protein IPM60_16495 [Rhodospirillales bacterium]|nr:hypothetical protein [Rhodospirillales bacterium]